MANPKFWTGDKLMSMSALLVSALTLIVFVYQTTLIRKQQYLSVYPHLRLSNNYSRTLKYQYTLVNEGIGPAFINSVQIIGPGGETYADFINYVDDAVSKEDSIIYFHATLNKGKVIPVGETVFLIQLLGEDQLKDLGMGDLNIPENTLEGANKLYDILNNDSLQFSITYSSVYGEQWVLGSDNVPVKR